MPQLPNSDAHLRWPVIPQVAELDARYLELLFADDLNAAETAELNSLIAEKEARAERMGV